MNLVMIDNYDSFTYNLVQFFGELKPQTGAELEIRVFRNDQVSVAELEALHPDYLVVSPGPCTPAESGISMQAIRFFTGKIPVLGVCLGHQCIGEAFGGKVIRAPQPVHGKVGMIEHDNTGLFQGLPNRFQATRYHSLVVERETLPVELEVSAVLQSDSRLIMGFKHREHPTFGLQFHPESIFTPLGKQLLQNFLNVRS
jgi:anthranilate synthase/aminodeoxychorismate synthase-like glutamine amidotransferase